MFAFEFDGVVSSEDREGRKYDNKRRLLWLQIGQQSPEKPNFPSRPALDLTFSSRSTGAPRLVLLCPSTASYSENTTNSYSDL